MIQNKLGVFLWFLVFILLSMIPGVLLWVALLVFFEIFPWFDRVVSEAVTVYHCIVLTAPTVLFFMILQAQRAQRLRRKSPRKGTRE